MRIFKNKKAIALVIAVALLAMLIPASAFAEDEVTVYIDFEGYNLGLGFFIEPTKMTVPEGTTAAQLTKMLLDANDKAFTQTGSVNRDNFYLSGVNGFVPQEFVLQVANMPPYLQDAYNTVQAFHDGLKFTRNTSYLSEKQFYSQSGWMITINNILIGESAGASPLPDNAVVRWQYTIYGLGADVGLDTGWGEGAGPLFSQQNKDDLIRALFNENATPAAKVAAFATIINPISTASQIQSAIEALTKTEEPNPEPTEALAKIKLPTIVSNQASSTFEASIEINKWFDGSNLIKGVVTVPSYLEVVSMQPTASLSGGQLDYNLHSDGKLRFAYLSTSLTGLNFNSALPANAFTITFRLKEALAADTEVKIAIAELSAQDSAANQPKAYGVASSEGIAVAKPSGTVAPVARELYTGDGQDLISADLKAIAVKFDGLDNSKPQITLGSTVFYYSKEYTQRDSSPTYVAIVGKTKALSSFESWGSYQTASTAPEEVLFGDTDASGTVNAQDALNIISSWLRKTDAPNNKGILIQNVSADGRIDTVDALAVVEYFVADAPMPIYAK